MKIGCVLQSGTTDCSCRRPREGRAQGMTQGELREVREPGKGSGRGPCERVRGDRSRTAAVKGRGSAGAARRLRSPVVELRCGVGVRQGRRRVPHPFVREPPRDVRIGAWAWRTAAAAVERGRQAQANQSVSSHRSARLISHHRFDSPLSFSPKLTWRLKIVLVRAAIGDGERMRRLRRRAVAERSGCGRGDGCACDRCCAHCTHHLPSQSAHRRGQMAQ